MFRKSERQRSKEIQSERSEKKRRSKVEMVEAPRKMNTAKRDQNPGRPLTIRQETGVTSSKVRIESPRKRRSAGLSPGSHTCERQVKKGGASSRHERKPAMPRAKSPAMPRMRVCCKEGEPLSETMLSHAFFRSFDFEKDKTQPRGLFLCSYSVGEIH